MSYMFFDATSFNNNNMPLITKIVPLDDTNSYIAWNVSNVTCMHEMFSGAILFNQDISNWNTSKVKYMENMFKNAKNHLANGVTSNENDILPLKTKKVQLDGTNSYLAWSVSNVQNMNSMFKGANLFNQEISNWYIKNVKNMNNMFKDAISFNQDISNWDVSNVINMTNMFSGAKSFNQHNIGLWTINESDDYLITGIFADSGITRRTFELEGRVYGIKIAEYFDPHLPNPINNRQIIELISENNRRNLAPIMNHLKNNNRSPRLDDDVEESILKFV